MLGSHVRGARRTIGWMALSAVLLVGSSAEAIDPKDAAYYCTPEASGGLRYDEQLKKWRSANFRPGDNFVLKLKFISTSNEPLVTGANPITVFKYKITITKAGSTDDAPCADWQADNYLVTIPASQGLLRCSYSINELQFNPSNNRFLMAYLYGYINGRDTNDDTPSITAGVCTKIN